MDKISPIYLKEGKLSYLFRLNVFQTLVYGLIFILFIWCAQYHWKRRRLYQMARQRPGPPTLPFIGNALYFVGSTSDIFQNVIKLVNKFKSPLPVWLGSQLFFAVFEPKDLETVMNSPHALKKDARYKYAEPLVGTGLFTAPVPKWKRHRKIILPTFNQTVLDGFVETFSEQSEILVKQLENEVGKDTLDIGHYVSRCALDIFCETAMGVSVKAQTNDADYIKWTNKALEIIFTRMFNIWFHFDFIFKLSPLSKEFDDVIKNMHAFTGKVVKEKREQYQKERKAMKKLSEGFVDEETKSRKSFLQQLIELSEEGANFTDEELREEVDTFMIAGSDTTGITNCFTFIMLGMFPDIQQKVYEEVLEVLGPDRPVEAADLRKFKYMELVLKETLRIFPAVPLVVRTVTEDIKLEKCTVPAGSSVVMVIIGVHRDENIWPDPLRFDPNRFLPEEVSKRHSYSWLSFSGGRRNCAGPKFAMMAMKALLAIVIRKYKISTDYKNIQDIKLKVDLLLKPVDGYKISIKLRNEFK